jgi:hypothetical protein
MRNTNIHKYRIWDKDRKEYLSTGRIIAELYPKKYPTVPKLYLDQFDPRSDLSKYEIGRFGYLTETVHLSMKVIYAESRLTMIQEVYA